MSIQFSKRAGAASLLISPLVGALLMLGGCGDDRPGADGRPSITQAQMPAPLVAFNNPLGVDIQVELDPHFIAAGNQQLAHWQRDNQQLEQAVKQFLACDFNDGSAELRWQQVRKAWHSSHHSWHRAGLFLALAKRYPNKLAAIISRQDAIHSSPITPGYIDGIEGHPFSGLVNDITVPITAEAIRAQHQLYDLSEISTGLHVLEFLLWGRQWQDYDPRVLPTQSQAIASIHKKHLPEQRRRALLGLLSTLLLEDSLALQQRWQDIGQRLTLANTQQQTLLIDNGLYQLQHFERHNELLNSPYEWQLSVLDNLQQQLQERLGPPLSAEQQQPLNKHFENLQTSLKAAANEEASGALQRSEQVRRDRDKLQEQLQQLKGLLITNSVASRPAADG